MRLGNFCHVRTVGLLARPQLNGGRGLRYNDLAVRFNKAIRDFDRDQFASQIMTHLDHLYRVAYYLVKNAHEAQDCVQETCVRALASWGQFTPGTNMKAWLTRILYNFFYDTYARGRRVVSAETLVEGGEKGTTFWETLPAENPGPESRLLEGELEAEIGAALRRIPEEFRAPIVLVDMGDFSYAEAGEILACPVGTIRSRLSRGRKLLHKELSSYVGIRETQR
jgi:RNA polymerase sigma-70 factor (ECF subfamily)